MDATVAVRQTQIGQRLEELAAHDDYTRELAAEVTRIVREVAPILDRYASAAPTFTRHDAAHALSVLTIMGKIVPQETLDGLGALDLALLVLSAYLHDVGMSPPEDELGRLRSLLDTGDTEQWAGREAELAEFRDYLTVRWSVSDLPLRKTVPQRELTNRRRSIVTDWVRQHHAARSSQAIEDHATRRKEPWRLTYRGYEYGHLLKLTCVSHDCPTSELRGAEFEAFGLGQGSRERCCPRYVAIALRVADILDVSSSRAPEALFHHQDVTDVRGIAEWHKHQAITVFEATSERVVLEAQPEVAFVHAAVLETIAGIEQELRECSRVIKECGDINVEGAHYRWTLSEIVEHRVTPHDQRYEYFDAAFRPDTEQVLKLFAGSAMYRNQPWAAFRELLQNAFDAVREKQARTRLAAAKRGDGCEVWGQLGVQEIVDISMDVEGDDLWLVCSDTGVGMERRHFEEYIVRTGRSSTDSLDIARLRRECKDYGVPFARTSKFGIGVLSYFMIADEVEFRTQRDQCCVPTEGLQWRFATQGIGSCGELTKAETQAIAGTTVRLRLRPELWLQLGFAHWARDEWNRWYDPLDTDEPTADDALQAISIGLAAAIWRTFLRVPCRVVVCLPDGKELQFGPGWLRSEEHVAGEVREQLERVGRRPPTTPRFRPTSNEQARADASQEAWTHTCEQTLKSLRVHSVRVPEGIEGDLGVHVRIPYFELGEHGASQVYLQLQRDDLGVLIRPFAGLLHGYLYEGGDTLSYHGAHVTDAQYDPEHEEPRPPYAASMDIVSDALGAIAPDRFAVELKRPKYDTQAGQAVAQAYREFLRERVSPAFRAVSLAATRGVGGRSVGDDGDLGEVWWAVRSEYGGTPELRWEKLCGEFIRPPTGIVFAQGAGDWSRLRNVTSGTGESYRVLSVLALLHTGFAFRGLLSPTGVRVSRFVAARGLPGATHALPFPLVTVGRRDVRQAGARVPEEWVGVAAIEGVPVADHALIRLMGLAPTQTAVVDPEEFLASPEGLARAIILGRSIGTYNKVASRAETELRRTWGLLEEACEEELPYIANWSVHGLHVYTRTGARRISDEDAEYQQYLPWPDDPKWTADLEFWPSQVQLPWPDDH